MTDTPEIILRKDAKAIGRKHYYTGKKCINGHTSFRFVSNHYCIECAQERSVSKSKGVKRHRVSDDEITAFIDGCESYSEFRSSREYTQAMKRGFHGYALDRLGLGKTTQRWNAKTCAEEALRFSSRSQFSSRSSGAYDAALTLGIIDDVCTHMERPLTDADVVYLWGLKRDDVFIVKVGITSCRLGVERIYSVSKKSGLSPEFAFKVKTQDARRIEREVLDFGHEYDAGLVNGFTEFRTMTLLELNEILGNYPWKKIRHNKDHQSGSNNERVV